MLARRTLAWAVLIILPFLFTAGTADATTCCDPRTEICTMVFDPYCDLPLCWPSTPINVVINHSSMYVLSCTAIHSSFTVAQGAVSISAGGQLIIQ